MLNDTENGSDDSKKLNKSNDQTLILFKWEQNKEKLLDCQMHQEKELNEENIKPKGSKSHR